MRRLLSVALIGLAVAGSTTVAAAQGRGKGARAGNRPDSARVARLDSARAARGDTARRRGPDSLRMKRLDSLRATGVLDSARRGRANGGARGGAGMQGRGRGDVLGGGRGALAGIKLNDNEKSAVKTITEKYREELKQLRDANQKPAAGQNAQLRQQMEAINTRMEAEIRAALTAEHQAQFDANIAKRPARGVGAPPPGRRPPARRPNGR